MAVVKGPSAISDENGNYTINNVPPGKLHVDCVAGTLRNANQKVTVGAGASGQQPISLQGKVEINQRRR